MNRDILNVGWEKLDLSAIEKELSHPANWEPLGGLVKMTSVEKIRFTP